MLAGRAGEIVSRRETPSQCGRVGSPAFLPIIIWWPQGISKEFDLWLTLADPCMTFDPSNGLRSGHGFFLPNLVAIGLC